MDLIPVLDLLCGHVVRGVAGQRETYAPIKSRLTASSQPRDVARSIRDAFGLHRLYVADLDAIMYDTPQWSLIDALVSDEFELMLDAGLVEPTRATQLVERGVTQVVAALETLPNHRVLSDIVSRIGADCVVFSLDLMHGRPLCDHIGWDARTPLAIVDAVIATGVSSLIVLDLSAVGVGEGVPTLELCQQLHTDHPTLRLITGGGVRNADDLRTAEAAGINGLLVASALHNGALS